MPKLLTLNSIGSKGLNSDVPEWDLPPEYITHGKNFRIHAGAISSSGGSEIWSSAPATFNAGHLRPVRSDSDFILAAGRTAVYAFDGNLWTNITSAAGYAGIGAGDENKWTSCMLGRIPILNNPQHQPEFWSPQSAGQIMQPLQFDASNTWAAKGYSAKVIRSHKNFLFALGLQEGATELPTSYRWSTAADVNGLPFTWDEADPLGIAGKDQIDGSGGDIIDGLSLRDAFAIYSFNGISMLDFVGGEFIFKERVLSTTTSVISKDCVVEVKGTHFFLADGDIVRNDGNRIDSIIHNKIRRRLTSNMSVDGFENSYVLKHEALKEIWFCVPEESSTYPNIAYIYNWKDDSWAVRDLPENIAFSAYAPRTAPADTWDTVEGTWDTISRTWGSRKLTPLDETIIGIDIVEDDLVYLDPDVQTSDLNTVIERIGFPLEGHMPVTSISRVYPHIEGSSDLEIQFGSQDHAGAPVRWKPAVKFNPDKQRKVDIRTTGELHCWRITSIGTGKFTMSGMDIEYVENGIR